MARRVAIPAELDLVDETHGGIIGMAMEDVDAGVVAFSPCYSVDWGVSGLVVRMRLDC